MIINAQNRFESHPKRRITDLSFSNVGPNLYFIEKVTNRGLRTFLIIKKKDPLTQAPRMELEGDKFYPVETVNLKIIKPKRYSKIIGIHEVDFSDSNYDVIYQNIIDKYYGQFDQINVESNYIRIAKNKGSFIGVFNKGNILGHVLLVKNV